MSDEHNPLAEIGHNRPPPDQNPDYLAIKKRVDDLMAEIRHWADGVQIENQAQADAVANLINLVRRASSDADQARKKENEPHDKAKAEVQERYGEFIADTTKKRGCLVMASATLLKLQGPWLRKLEAEQLAREEEAAAKAQEAAEEARKLREAASAQETDLAAQEAAQVATQAAEDAAAMARQAEKAKPQAKSTTGRAIGLKSVWRTELVNPKEALAHYMKVRAPELREFLIDLAEAEVRQGKRELPGFKITEERVPV